MPFKTRKITREELDLSESSEGEAETCSLSSLSGDDEEDIKVSTKIRESSGTKSGKGVTQSRQKKKEKYKRIKADEVIIPKENVSHMLVCGRTMWGKSYLIDKVVRQNKRNFNDIFLITGSGQFCDDYKFIPKENRYSVSKTIPVLKKLKKVLMEAKENKINYTILVIFDDILGGFDKKTMNYLDKTIATCRHYNLYMLFSTQKVEKYISTTVRGNVGHIFMGRVGMGPARNIFDLQEEIDNKYEYEHLYKKHINKRHSFIHFNNTTDKDNLVLIE